MQSLVKVTLASYALLWLAVWSFHWCLPDPVPASAPLSVFSEERARDVIRSLSEGIGVRMVGTKNNDEKAVAYITKRLNEIKASAPKDSFFTLEMEKQETSGAFNIEFLKANLTTAYTGLKNILVRLTPKTQAKAQHGEPLTLLFSSHFDSAVSSPAASDDLSGIGTMMELVSVLMNSLASRFSSKDGLFSPMVFNFNGGEEFGMQAAHGFITQHKWGQSIGAFLNLESCGSGGKETLFQTGPSHPWLAETYARNAPHPHGSVAGQDVFQRLKAIPGDTDFRIYRDYGEVPGLDFAYYVNGQVYHTVLDRVDHISQGSLQHEGENVLATAIALITHPHMVHPALFDKPAGLLADNVDLEAVYYDIPYLGMFYYSITTASLLYYSFALLSAYLFYNDVMNVCSAFSRKNLPSLQSRFLVGCAISFGTTSLSLLAAAIPAACVGALLSFVFDHKLSWYSNQWLATFLFGCPAVVGVLFLQSIVERYALSTLRAVKLDAAKVEAEESGSVLDARLSPSAQPTEESVHRLAAGMCFWGTQGFAVLLLLALHIAGYGMAYLPFWLAAFPLLVRFAATLAASGDPICSLRKRPLAASQAEAALSVILPGLATLYMGMQFLGLFLPIMGRSGAQAPSDVVAAVTTSVMVLLPLLPSLPALHSSTMRARLTLVCTSASIVFVVVALWLSPYSDAYPKRLFVQNSVHLTPVQGTTEAGLPLLTFSQNGDSTLDVSWCDAIGLAESGVLERACPNAGQLRPAGNEDFQALHPFTNFLAKTEIPAQCAEGKTTLEPNLSQLRVEVQYEKKDGATRTLGLKVSFGERGCFSMLNLTDSHIVVWSLTPNMPVLYPEPANKNANIMVRHIGLGATTFSVTLPLDAPTLKVKMSIMCPRNGNNGEEVDFSGSKGQLFVNKLPSWTTTAISETSISTWSL